MKRQMLAVMVNSRPDAVPHPGAVSQLRRSRSASAASSVAPRPT